MTIALLEPAERRRSRVRVTLSDGRRVVIRTLDAADAPALRDAIEHADATDLRRRFMGAPPPTTYILERLEHADRVHNFALGAFDDDGRLVAGAQFDRSDDEPRAEVAIEVATDWQRCGLGTRMLERLADVARGLGISQFTASYFADNVAVRRLLHTTGRVAASSIEHGCGFAVLDISEASGQGRTNR
jgi:RimJ/RimL family protein N-acetyltransferase